MVRKSLYYNYDYYKAIGEFEDNDMFKFHVSKLTLSGVSLLSTLPQWLSPSPFAALPNPPIILILNVPTSTMLRYYQTSPHVQRGHRCARASVGTSVEHEVS
jgi:hypothetical protein